MRNIRRTELDAAQRVVTKKPAPSCTIIVCAGSDALWRTDYDAGRCAEGMAVDFSAAARRADQPLTARKTTVKLVRAAAMVAARGLASSRQALRVGFARHAELYIRGRWTESAAIFKMRPPLEAWQSG